METTINTLAGPVNILLSQDGTPASLPTIGYQTQDPRVQTQAVAGAAVISGGTITGIPVLMPGNGYTAAPVVTVSGGGGSSASATSVLNGGSVKSITVNTAGTGYTSAPFVKIAAPTGITGISNAFNLVAGGPGVSKANFGEFTFYTIGLSTGTINLKLVGWNQVVYAGTPGVWKPKTLAYLLGTIGATTGASDSLTPPFASHNVITTLAVNSSIIVPNYDLWTSDLGIATVRLDLSGSQAVSLVPGAVGSGTCTGINGTIQTF